MASELLPEDKKIIKFYGRKHPLSNFYEAPFRIGSFIFPTVEHFYQAMKSEDMYERLDIIMADTPAEAKKLGRSIRSFREGWPSRRNAYMWKALKEKFSQNDKLKEYLLGTGDAFLVENSPYDDYWGRGRNWDGKNRMGEMLMKLRDLLRGKEINQDVH